MKHIEVRLLFLHPLALLRLFFSPLLLAALILTLAAPARAAEDAPRKAAGACGKRKLLLFAKNPTDWSITRGGASGQLVYRSSSGAFTLHASRLRPRSGFALVRVADIPPQAEILARGTSDSRGNLELQGTWHNWSNKFWLVVGEDVAGATGTAGTLKSWRPERYLFEEKQLGVACACPEPEEP
jgi:hypothetical protein